MPPGFAGVEQQLLLWMVALLRPGAAFVAAPVFGAAQVPLQLRLVVALAIGIAGQGAAGFALPAAGMLSPDGVALVAGEVVIGAMIGLAVQLGFAAALTAGEVIGNAMGIGFAAMNDPLGGPSSPALGQFLLMLATFLFLASDGHLLFARILVESYAVFTPGRGWPSGQMIGSVTQLGGLIFAAGLTIAFPVAAALILVQLIMGLLARSAPALNLFSVGMPAALLAGTVLLAMATPVLAEAILHAIGTGLDAAVTLAGGQPLVR